MMLTDIPKASKVKTLPNLKVVMFAGWQGSSRQVSTMHSQFLGKMLCLCSTFQMTGNSTWCLPPVVIVVGTSFYVVYTACLHTFLPEVWLYLVTAFIRMPHSVFASLTLSKRALNTTSGSYP